MKKFKRFASVVMVIMMMLSMMLPAMAGTITISNTVKDETYSAYKIFDVTYSGTGENATYAYTIEGNSAWYNTVNTYATNHPTELTLTPTADSTDNTYIVNMAGTEVLNAADFAAYLIENIGSISADASEVATSEDTVITVAKAGYYLVDSTFGALCILNTADDSVQVEEKNAKPTLEKTVKEDSTGDYGESATADIGQTVDFKLTVDVGTEVTTEPGLGIGNDDDFVITDTLPSGMTYVDGSVTIDGWTVGTDFTVVYQNDVLTITLLTAKLATLASASEFDILYKATLDSDAVVEGAGNVNTAHLEYNEYTTVDETATVYTYAFDVVKTDGTNSLDGAKFELYDAQTGGSKIALVKEGDVYRKATPAEIAAEGFVSAVIEAGTARITGLDDLDNNGTEYWLEEIEAPAGYNALDGRVKVTAVSGKNETLGENDPQTIVNKTGTELPSTGGIGTTIFYCLGGAMVLGAFVLLITKKRMSREM